MPPTNRLGTFVFTSAFCAVTGLCAAGPLNPPAGAIGATAKPLAEIEPRTAINAVNTPGDTDSVYRITQPGSYYLTETLMGVAGKRGIEIDLPTEAPIGTAMGLVTIDLNGFALESNSNVTGQNGGAGTLDGIKLIGFARVVLRNGTVRGWGGHGIDLSSVGAGPPPVMITGVTASNNSGCGIKVIGGGLISGCITDGNFEDGILAMSGVNVTDCRASGNNRSGFSVTLGTVERCFAMANRANGFHVATSTLTDCVSRDNTMNGFYDNSWTAYQRCMADANTQVGFLLGGESSVIDSTATNNRGGGITCVFNSTVRGNTCAKNGSKNAGGAPGDGAAIRVTGTGNRIEGNNCTESDRGLQVDSIGSIIIGNTCRGNTTNWQIAAGNSYGPIVNGGSGAAYTGSGTAAGSVTTTNPNANFNF